MIDREIIIEKARKFYIATGLTNNITEALRLYLQNDANKDEQIPLWIFSPEINQLRKILKEIRPRCDECNAELHLQFNARDPAGKEYSTSWICKNCELEYFSDKTPAEWLKELQDEARKQNLQQPDKPVEDNMSIVWPWP